RSGRAAFLAGADPDRGAARRPARDRPRRRLSGLVRRGLRDRRVPPRRRRLLRRDLRMSEPYVAGPVEAERGPFLELSQEGWERMVGDARRIFLGARDYGRSNVGGRIVLVSAAAAARPIEGAALEGVAGAFLTTIAQVAAVELAERGITANVVVPALEPDE